MPFKCELTLGESLELGDEVEFVGWVEKAWSSDSDWGNIVPADTPYARARKNNTLGEIFTTFRGALMKQGKLLPGVIINNETVLAIMAAEGDEIAYGKPYSIFKKDT